MTTTTAPADATTTAATSPPTDVTATAATAFQPGANRVSFSSEGETLVGNLYLPAGYQAGQRLPAVVIAPTWTSVKEQMAGLYAARLADAGNYATLAFDFRFYGESSGEPRNYENPAAKSVDIQNAITFLQTLPVVNPDQILGLGICAGSGYMADAAAADPRIRSLALVAPWLHNAELVRTIYGGEEGVQQRLAAATTAREQYESTGEVAYVPAISTTDQNAAMFGDFDYYLNPQRGAIPQWGNQFAVMAWQDWLTYDPHPAAAEIDAPVVIVHSPDAAVPDGARLFFDQLSAPKQFVWLSGSQFDFYDQEPNLGRSLDEVVAHFNATLTGQPSVQQTLADEVRALQDQMAVIKTVDAVGFYADMRQWDQVQAQFADQAVLDYTSYAQAQAGAQEPEPLTPAEVVAAWQRVLPGYDHTQHLISNHQVTLRGNEAEVTSSIHATHTLIGAEGGDQWIFIGDYQHRLLHTDAGWKITRMQANLRAQSGNPNLPALAEQRVQQPSAPPAP